MITLLAAAGLLCCAAGPVAASGSAAVSHSAPNPVQAAREVFQDQDFWWKRIDSRTVSMSWLERLLTAIGESIGRTLVKIAEFIFNLLRRLFRILGGSSSGGASIAVWGLVGALVVWSIWRMAPFVARWLSEGRARRVEDGAVSEALPEAANLFEQAGAAFSTGAYAEAIRLALLALIARLEKQGLLRYDTTRTNREYQLELAPACELAVCFGQVARIYDRTWYGRMTPGRADAERVIALCGSIINREELAPE
jgi:hypothetical protein